jgi:hypothetical protein
MLCALLCFTPVYTVGMYVDAAAAKRILGSKIRDKDPSKDQSVFDSAFHSP